MNTSMPTTPTDLAALVKGGSSSGTTSQLKGMFADLTQGRSASTETASDTGSDFESMLDTPAPGSTDADAAAALATKNAGRGAGEGTAKTIESGRCVLSTELSAPATATLQIKGIVSCLVQPLARASAPGIAGADVSTSSANEARPGLGRCRSQSVATLLAPAMTQNESAGETVAAPAESVSTAEEETAEVAILTLPAPVAIVPDDQASQAIVAATLLNNGIAPEPTLVPSGSGVTETGDASAPDESGLPAAEGAVVTSDGNSVPVATKAGDSSIATAQAPAKGLRTHALLHRAAGSYFARTDNLLPAVKNHRCAVAAPVGETTEQPVVPPIDSAQRRELIDTVAALITPLLSAWPANPASAETADPAVTADGTSVADGESEKSPGTSVTIKLPGRPPITLELPFSTALSSAIEKSAQNSEQIPSGDSVAGSADPIAPVATEPYVSPVEAKPGLAASVQTLLQQPALDTALPEESPLDFRVQVKPALDKTLPEDAALNFRVQVKNAVAEAWAKNEARAGMADFNAGAKDADAATQPDMSGFDPEIRRLGFAGNNDFDPAPMNRGKYDQLFAPSAERVQESALNSERLAASPRLPQQPPQDRPEQTTGTGPVELLVELPGMGTLTAEIVAAQPALVSGEKRGNGRIGRAEKTAGDFKSVATAEKEGNILSEKTFLSAAGSGFKAKANEAGTDVANLGDNMPAPFTSRRLSVDPLELPPRFNTRGELLQGLNELQNFSPPAESIESATPAPVLAHRAVETIMNVVDAQRNGSANASSVNLHFKFGGDDLAVKVQMRGGEVLTQFLTDSAELRSALSNEWQVMAGQGGALGLRLLEPTIMPASAGVATGFGSASQGQGHSQQQQQQTLQHHAQTAAAFGELRGLRRGAAVAARAQEISPRVSIAQPTSHHLTALA